METEDERLARLEEVAEVSDDLLEDEDDGPLLPLGIDLSRSWQMTQLTA